MKAEMENGVGIVPSPPPAQSMANQKFLTPSRAKYGLGGRFLLRSCHEMRRNNTIEELQGTRNPFIDHPKRVEDLEF